MSARPLVLAGLVAGCARVSVAVLPPAQVAAKPFPCEFSVMWEAPERAYQEIARVEFHEWFGTRRTREEFKEAVGWQVCQVGGDAVLARRGRDVTDCEEEHGERPVLSCRYFGATVIRWR